MLVMILLFISTAMTAPPITSTEEAIARSIGPPYTVPAGEARFLMAAKDSCGLMAAGDSPCLFTVSQAGVAELLVSNADIVTRLGAQSSLYTGAHFLKCGTSGVECRLRAGFKKLPDGKRIMNVLLTAHRPGSVTALDTVTWFIPEGTGQMYQLP